jgi:hypothetical protein
MGPADLFITYDFIVAGIVGVILGYLYTRVLGGEKIGGIITGILMGASMFIGKFLPSLLFDAIAGIIILTISFFTLGKMGLLKSLVGAVLLYFGSLMVMGFIGMFLGMPVTS